MNKSTKLKELQSTQIDNFEMIDWFETPIGDFIVGINLNGEDKDIFIFQIEIYYFMIENYEYETRKIDGENVPCIIFKDDLGEITYHQPYYEYFLENKAEIFTDLILKNLK